MKKILLIDDDLDFNMVIKEVLQEAGYKVVCAFNGKQGLKMFKEEKPDLVITDIIMPEMDGIEFLIDTLENEDGTPCKIIVISGGGRAGGIDYLQIIKTIGIDVVLRKPFKIDELLNSAEAMLAEAE